MASVVSSQKFLGKVAALSYDHDPGTTNALMVSPDGGTTKRSVDMSGYDGFALAVFNSVSTSSSGPTKIEIVAAEDSAMSSNLTVIKDSGTLASTHVGDTMFLECTAAEIQALGAPTGLALRYVAGRITCSNAGDECVATYIRHTPVFAGLDLTANYIQ